MTNNKKNQNGNKSEAASDAKSEQLSQNTTDGSGTRADDESGFENQRQPKFTESGDARSDAFGRFYNARKNYAFRPRADSRTHRSRARCGGARLFRVDRIARRIYESEIFNRSRQENAGCLLAFQPSPVRAVRPIWRVTCAVLPSNFIPNEGNFDFVGNNIPVFFIQDAIKFPDLIHAVKPEPHNEIPQAASAHDTFWDFISLMPESMHMIMWVMSDRAIPRSLRMMEGFGIHTFRLINKEGKATFVKFHWKPKLGVHSVAWNEAQKISGLDADFHRRDLWEAIESGAFPNGNSVYS